MAVVLVMTPCSLVYGREFFGVTSAFMFCIEEGVNRFLRNVRAYRPDYTLPHPITESTNSVTFGPRWYCAWVAKIN